MPTTSTPPTFSAFPTTSARTADGVTHIDLAFATAMGKGSGSIFITDGAVQTVIDRVTGQPKLRVVGASFTKEISLDQVNISGNHVLFDAAGLPPGATLNLYMGAGTLLSGGKAAGAITVPGSAAFTTPAAEPLAALSATIALANGILKAGAPLEMVVSFSHAVNEVPAATVFSAEHARVEFVSRSEDGLSWRFRLVQDDSVDSASNVVRLNLGAVQPRDARPHSGTVTSSPYAVDTLVDSWVGARIGISDLGLSASDGITSDDRQIVSGTLVGSIDEGEHLELVINERTVDSSKISFTTADGITTWRYDSASERVGDAPAHLFNHGTNTILARVVGNGHASPAVTRTITVDTDVPELASAPDGNVALDLNADLVITFSEAVHWFADTTNSDPAYKEDVLAIWIGDGQRRIAFDTSWLSADGLSLRIPAAVHQLTPDTGYNIVLPRTLTDTAGNPFYEYEIHFHTDDGLLPSAEQVSVYNTDGYYRAGDQIEFYVRFSEDVEVVEGAQPSLLLSNGKQARFTEVYGDEMLFTYTVAAGDDIAKLGIDTSQLAGKVADLSGKLLDAAHIQIDGIHDGSGYGAMIDLVVDTTAPTAPAAATLDATSDSGTPGDRITNDASPALRGTAEPHARIRIYEGTTPIGNTIADASGAWSIASILPLNDGAHNITVVQLDRAGNESTVSAALALTIDIAIPVAPAAPVLDAASDSGSAGDGITSDNSPTLSGTAEADATVEIYDGTTLLGSTTANASGAWSATVGASTALTDGVHNITVRQVDRAGNKSDPSPALALTISTGAPAAAVLASASDSDALGDGITSDNSPTLSGTVEANATVEIYDGTTLLGSTTANASGAWSTTLGTATALADGVHNITIRLVDGSGNRSTASAPLALTIDTAAPAAPAALALTSGSDTGNIGDHITSDNSPTLSGIADANARVGIYEGTTLLGTATADAAGLWFATLGATTPLSDGEHGITARQFDRAGNTSAASSALALKIDTGAPAALSAPILASDTGISGVDGITNERYAVLSGSGAEPFTEVRIVLGSTVYGSGMSDEAGNWTAHFSSPLEAGAYSFKVRQVDRAGNLGAESPSVSFTVDLTGPASAPPKPLLAALSDSGALNSDGITNDTTPTFTGSGALANSVVVLFVDEREVGDTVTDALGNWSITSSALSEGYHSVGVKQFDAAGNKSGYSESFDLEIDTTAPASAPGIPDLDEGSDSGISISDNITRITTPTFSGGGALANGEVALIVGSAEVGRATADASGNWSITSSALADGTHQVRVRQFDLAGNQGPDSDPLSVTIDTVGPTASIGTLNRDARKFLLPFSESIVFTPSGQFKLFKESTQLLSYLGNNNNNSSSWSITADSDGDLAVLNFNITLDGLLKLQWTNGSVTDLAGNAATIIGTPEWVFTM